MPFSDQPTGYRSRIRSQDARLGVSRLRARATELEQFAEQQALDTEALQDALGVARDDLNLTRADFNKRISAEAAARTEGLEEVSSTFLALRNQFNPLEEATRFYDKMKDVIRTGRGIGTSADDATEQITFSPGTGATGSATEEGEWQIRGRTYQRRAALTAATIAGMAGAIGIELIFNDLRTFASGALAQKPTADNATVSRTSFGGLTSDSFVTITFRYNTRTDRTTRVYYTYSDNALFFTDVSFQPDPPETGWSTGGFSMGSIQMRWWAEVDVLEPRIARNESAIAVLRSRLAEVSQDDIQTGVEYYLKSAGDTLKGRVDDIVSDLDDYALQTWVTAAIATHLAQAPHGSGGMGTALTAEGLLTIMAGMTTAQLRRFGGFRFINATNFTGRLATTDDTLQEFAQKFNDLVVRTTDGGGGGITLPINIDDVSNLEQRLGNLLTQGDADTRYLNRIPGEIVPLAQVPALPFSSHVTGQIPWARIDGDLPVSKVANASIPVTKLSDFLTGVRNVIRGYLSPGAGISITPIAGVGPLGIPTLRISASGFQVALPSDFPTTVAALRAFVRANAPSVPTTPTGGSFTATVEFGSWGVRGDTYELRYPVPSSRQSGMLASSNVTIVIAAASAGNIRRAAATTSRSGRSLGTRWDVSIVTTTGGQRRSASLIYSSGYIYIDQRSLTSEWRPSSISVSY